MRVGPAQAVAVGGPVRHRGGTSTWGGGLCGLRQEFLISGGEIRVNKAFEELGFAGGSHCLVRRTDL